MPNQRLHLRLQLRRVLQATGLTASALARRAGLATTTLTRFLNNDDAPTLSARTWAKILDAANLPADFELQNTGAQMPHTLMRPLDDGAQLEIQDAPIATSLRAALLSMQQQMPAVDFWRITGQSLALAGYLPGDILIIDRHATPDRGDIVCAQHHQADMPSGAILFRMYQPPYLIAAPHDPSNNRPLLIDHDTVLVLGVVRESIRPAPAHLRDAA